MGHEIDGTALSAISGTVAGLQITRGVDNHHGGTVDAGLFLTNAAGSAKWNTGLYMDSTAIVSGGNAIVTQGFVVTGTGFVEIIPNNQLCHGAAAALCAGYTGAGVGPGITVEPSTAGSATAMQFNNSAGTAQGSISITGSGATAYNTTSDGRVKENFSPTTMGLDILMRVSVEDFNFIADPSKIKMQGFIAQDLYQVYSDAVTVGGDDPITRPWAIDYGRITPLIVKSVQDEQFEIVVLRNRVAELELGATGALAFPNIATSGGTQYACFNPSNQLVRQGGAC